MQIFTPMYARTVLFRTTKFGMLTAITEWEVSIQQLTARPTHLGQPCRRVGVIPLPLSRTCVLTSVLLVCSSFPTWRVFAAGVRERVAASGRECNAQAADAALRESIVKGLRRFLLRPVLLVQLRSSVPLFTRRRQQVA